MDQRAAIINYARAQFGKPYNLGSSGPDYYDCSGLTLMAWRAGNIQTQLDHYTVTQYEQTNHVPLSEALPGDLLFFGGYNPGARMPHHVGIYVAPGQMIDAPDYGIPIAIHNYNYYGDVMNVVGRVPVVAAPPLPNPVFPCKDRLLTGWTLKPGAGIWSADKTHWLTLQVDGNLVMYSNKGGRAHSIWAANTYAKPGKNKGTLFVVQTDGNLVVYDGARNPVWASYTFNPGVSALVVQRDGNLVQYGSDGLPIWQTRTSGK